MNHVPMLHRLLAAAIALLVLVFALVVWQLSQGPLSLAFAEPYLEEAVHGGQDDWRLEIGELVLMSDLKLHARNVDLLTTEGKPLLRVPDTVVRVSLRALLSGIVAVSAVEISNAEAHILRRPDGSFGVSVGEGDVEADSDADAEFLEDLLRPVRGDRAIGFLRHFDVINARLHINDLESGASFTIDNTDLKLSRGTRDHHLTLRAVLAGKKADESPALIESQLEVRPSGEGFVLDGEARATGVNAAHLPLYWPQNAAAATRRWVIANITAGRVPEAVVHIALASTQGTDFGVTRLEGSMRYDGLSVRWDDQAPPITGVAGSCTFDGSSMRFVVTSGSTSQISVRSGRVDLFDLDTDKEQVSIEVKAEGPLAEVVNVVPAASGKVPFQMTGNTPIDIQAAFALRSKLTFADVSLKVDADPSALEIHHATGGATISGRLRYQKRAKRVATLTADVDVDAAHVDVSDLRWKQEPGKKGAIALHLELGDGPLVLDPLRIDCPGLRAKGSITIADKGDAGSARLRQVVHGGTELDRVDVDWSPTMLKADIGSGTIHLPSMTGESDDHGKPVGKDAVPIDLEIQTGLLQRVSFDADSWLENVRATAVRRNGIWDRIDIRSELPRELWSVHHGSSERGTKAFVVNLEPAGVGWRLDGKADDFGTLLQALDLTNGVRGGTLEVAGRADRIGTDAVLRSHVKVTNFLVRGAPLALRILTVAALSKYVSTLKGDGLQFDSLKGTLIVRRSRYELDNVRAYGSSLGWTANGWVDTDADKLQVDGAVIPAYQANKVLKKIPILGALLTGPEGRGLIAITYKIGGNVRDPKVSTNPLTALTPGFLRGIWELGN